MNQFITANPELVSSFIGLLIVIVGWLVKNAFDRLTAAIKSLHDTINSSIADIGLLKDRMQRQETTCEMQREICPNRRIIYPHMGANTDPPTRHQSSFKSR